MSVELVADFLLWCTIINVALLLWWFLFFTLAHDWTYKMHSRWFVLSKEKFDAIHYAGMATFKMGILLLNLVPYIALRIAV